MIGAGVLLAALLVWGLWPKSEEDKIWDVHDQVRVEVVKALGVPKKARTQTRDTHMARDLGSIKEGVGEVWLSFVWEDEVGSRRSHSIYVSAKLHLENDKLEIISSNVECFPEHGHKQKVAYALEDAFGK